MIVLITVIQRTNAGQHSAPADKIDDTIMTPALTGNLAGCANLQIFHNDPSDGV
jgi:hypothetical protein